MFSIKGIIIGVAVLAVLAAFAGTYHAGFTNGEAQEALRTEREVARERRRQESIGAANLDAARQQSAETEVENLDNRRRVEDLDAELARVAAELQLRPVGDRACSENPVINPSIAERLNAIR